jgi:hypothetical protein
MVFRAALLTVAVAVSPAQWRSDIDYLASELPKRHPNPFHAVSQAAFNAELEAIKAGVDSMSDVDVALALQRAVATLAEAHTEVDTKLGGANTYFPLRFDVFDDGVFVVKTTPGAAAACGAKLVAIDGVPAGNAVARAETLASAENEQWRLARALAILSRAEALRFLGVTPSDTARFTFARGEMELRAQPASDLGSLFSPFNAGAEWPLYLQKGSSNYWFTWDAARGLLYIKYNLCADAQPSFASMVHDVFAIADAQNVERFVVDLRNNPGGSSQVVQPLIDALRQRPSLRGRLFALINRRTISSGMLAALDLRSAGAVLVGEPTGGKPNSYGDQRSFALPSSRVTVFHSTKFFNLVAGDPAALEPDIVVTMTSDDFFARRDPVLEAVLPPAAPRALTAAPLRRRASSPSPVRACP